VSSSCSLTFSNQARPPPPGGFAPPPQGFAPPPQGFTPPPQGFAPPPQGFAPPPQGFAPPPAFRPPTSGQPGTFPPPGQGRPPGPPQGFQPPPRPASGQGFVPPQQGSAPSSPGFALPAQGFAPPPQRGPAPSQGGFSQLPPQPQRSTPSPQGPPPTFGQDPNVRPAQERSPSPTTASLSSPSLDLEGGFSAESPQASHVPQTAPAAAKRRLYPEDISKAYQAPAQAAAPPPPVQQPQSMFSCNSPIIFSCCWPPDWFSTKSTLRWTGPCPRSPDSASASAATGDDDLPAPGATSNAGQLLAEHYSPTGQHEHQSGIIIKNYY